MSSPGISGSTGATRTGRRGSSSGWSRPTPHGCRRGSGSCRSSRIASAANRSLEGEFERQMDAFIADAEARYDRSATDDEALFYLGNAHFLRAAYRFDHDKGMWGAARDGARSKRLADAYVKRHPEHGDAYFMLGAYNYYVEIAPSFVKLIRPLLFLPAGNRAEGLKQLERAYTQGSLFSFQAGMLLMEIYGIVRGAARGRRAHRRAARARVSGQSGGAVRSWRSSISARRSRTTPGAAAQYEKVIASESRRAEPRAGALPRPARSRVVAVAAVAQRRGDPRRCPRRSMQARHARVGDAGVPAAPRELSRAARRRRAAGRREARAGGAEVEGSPQGARRIC